VAGVKNQPHPCKEMQRQTDTHRQTHTYIYMCVCVCVKSCVLVSRFAAVWGTLFERFAKQYPVL